MRVAIYARVSTEDKGQDPTNQLLQLREWCANAGHICVGEYVDFQSGRKADREQFNLLFADAQLGEFDTVLFWALDRFSREGMIPTIDHLQRLAGYNVNFHSFTEPWLASDNELTRNILLAVMASLAKQEALRMSERTKAGMARAKANGKRIGRPAISEELRQKIAERVAEVGAYAAAKELGVDRKTVTKYTALQYDVTPNCG
jgi:DNA invertase Pin-like site-specific DNA recombinase